jgi:hypothetical protein
MCNFSRRILLSPLKGEKTNAMRNHTVQISDRDGHSFKMALSTVSAAGRVKDGFGGDFQNGWATMTGLRDQHGDARVGNIYWDRQVPGNWRTLDQGFLRYGGGKLVNRDDRSRGVDTRDVFLLTMDGTWGMQLFEYEDTLGVNDEGTGSVIQPWVVGFTPGKISWVLVD